MKRAWVIAIAVVALGAVAIVKAQPPRSVAVQMKAAQQKAEVEGDLKGAIEDYKKIVAGAGTNRALAAEALVRMAGCYQKLGIAEAHTIYERVVRDFGDQRAAVAAARTFLAAMQPAATDRQRTAREVWVGQNNQLRGFKLSTDGRYFALTDMAAGNVAVRDVTTGSDRLLTNTGDLFSEYAAVPVISPDGRAVAYTWYKDNKVEVRVVSAAGAEVPRPQVVLRNELNDGEAYQIAWMPDGQELLVTRRYADSTSQIGRLTIQDGSFRSLKSLEWRRPNMQSLSPDGRYVAYDAPAAEAGSPLDIVVLATDGSRETVVVKNPANDAFPVWSPDGSRLIFLSDRSGANALWTVPMADGRANGPAALLKSDAGATQPLAITKAGTLYSFEPPDYRRNLYITGLATLRPTSTPAPATERVIFDNAGPAWSRDGEYLAYYSLRNAPVDPSSGVLVIRSLKTGDERTVPLPSRVTSPFGAGPKWFPDNRSVLIERADAEGSGHGFYRLALDTGNTELLIRLPRSVSSYDLSADGRTLFYVVFVDDAGKLLRADLESHRETEPRKVSVVELASSGIISLALSPDGMQLATTLWGGVIEVRPSAGGEAREIFRPQARDIGTGAMRQALAWTSDQRFLLFVRGDRSLWKVPALGGQAEKVGPHTPGITVHPDGRRIVFSVVGERGASKVWALENFLPAQSAKRQ